jgi:hypothetical protein
MGVPETAQKALRAQRTRHLRCARVCILDRVSLIQHNAQPGHQQGG